MIFTGISAILTQKSSKKFGRPIMIFTVQSIAIGCLLLIATYPWVWILIPTFIMRGALMNSSQPLSRAIMMDSVPKKHRGKWNSLQAVAWGLFWNVSR